MSEPTICPQCGSKFSNFGVLKANVQLPDATNRLINEYSEPRFPYRCTNCGDAVLWQCLKLRNEEQAELTAYLQARLHVVPLVSSHSPQGWEYQTIGLVTAQSTLGTSIFADISSTFADIFGTQAKAYNGKIKASEDLCQSILRIKSLELGGDAILAVDIDYAEVGSGRGLVMVCMTGTAIKLRNPHVVNSELQTESKNLRTAAQRLSYLGGLNPAS